MSEKEKIEWRVLVALLWVFVCFVGGFWLATHLLISTTSAFFVGIGAVVVWVVGWGVILWSE